MLQQAYEHLVKDPTLGKIVKACQLEEININNEPMSIHLIKSIISQQLSTKAAATIYGRFESLFIDKSITLEQLLSFDDETLRSVGLSYSKAGYVKNVARYFLDTIHSEFNWSRLEDEKIVTQLTTIKGVGIWTVQMILIFKLNRPDVLPLDDLIVRKGLMQVLNIPPETKKFKPIIEQKSEIWKPYRSYVSRLMWKSKDLNLLDF